MDPPPSSKSPRSHDGPRSASSAAPMTKSTPQARPRFGSEAEIATSRLTQILIESHTLIIRGLWALAPKRRRSKLPWVILGGLLIVAAGLALDHSAREFLTGKARGAWAARHDATPPSAQVTPPETKVATEAPTPSAESAVGIGFAKPAEASPATSATPATTTEAATPSTPVTTAAQESPPGKATRPVKGRKPHGG